MSRGLNRLARVVGVLSVTCAAFAAPGPATADGTNIPRKAVAYCNTVKLHCDNSRTYDLCPIGVTSAAELVTGTLTTPSPHYVRAIPMGDGYRYAGKGIWFDGKRDAGRLYFGQNRSLACTVAWQH